MTGGLRWWDLVGSPVHPVGGEDADADDAVLAAAIGAYEALVPDPVAGPDQAAWDESARRARAIRRADVVRQSFRCTSSDGDDR